MKRIVANRFAGRFLHPGIESRSQRLALVLDGKINQRCGPAKSRGARTGFEIVRAHGPAKGHVEVSMYVDSAREYILARRIDNLSSVFPRQALSDGGNLPIADRDVAGVCVGCCLSATVNDDGVKAPLCLLASRGDLQLS